MFEVEPFSQLPGPALAAELAAADPHRLDDDTLAAYLRAAKRLEAWSASLLARGICAFAAGHQVADPEDPESEDDPEHADGGGDRDRSTRRRVRKGPARPVRFGAAGSPWVDEFAADQLAAVLQVAPVTAGHLIGDAQDLWARLPWVRTGLREGTVSWQAARAIAGGTRALSADRLEAANVDARLHRSATRLTPGQLRPRIAAVVAAADPDAVKAKDKTKHLHVGFSPQPQQQTTSIFGELDPTGAQRLDSQLSALARLLRRLDTTTAWEALRARALTLLADSAALARLQAQAAAATDSTADRSDPGGTGDISDPSGSPGADHAGTSGAEARLSTTVVHLHTDTQTWASGDGLVEVEGYGWVPLASLTDMLDQTHLRVVAATTDLAHDAPPEGHPGDAETARHHPDPTYEPRAHTRDHVQGRDRTCRFPGCNRRARACQCDHTRPWPHGPTCACNLGCLCTRHHRLKTHTDWHLRQPWPGIFLWRTPTGTYYLVDRTGTTRLQPDADHPKTA